MENLKFGKLQKIEQKIQTPVSRFDSESSDLRTMPTNVIINHLEDNLRIREMPLTERLKKGMLR